jgi:hypothetical protein
MESTSASPAFGTRLVIAGVPVPSQWQICALTSVLLPASTSSERRQDYRDP